MLLSDWLPGFLTKLQSPRRRRRPVDGLYAQVEFLSRRTMLSGNPPVVSFSLSSTIEEGTTLALDASGTYKDSKSLNRAGSFKG